MAKALPDLYDPDFTNVRLAPGRMAKAATWSDLTGKDRPDKPWLNGMPRIIFVSDMADALSDTVPFEYLKDEIIANVTSKAGQRHIWMWLTKRPKRMAEFSCWLRKYWHADWPANLWAGTSITGKATAGRSDDLLDVPAKVRFLSLEPLIEPVDLADLLDRGYESGGPGGWIPEFPFDLVIVGGESDQGQHRARPFDVFWAIELVQMCREMRISPFVKQLGSNPVFTHPMQQPGQPPMVFNLRDSHGGDWSEWPEDLKVREMPGGPQSAPITNSDPTLSAPVRGEREDLPGQLNFLGDDE